MVLVRLLVLVMLLLLLLILMLLLLLVTVTTAAGVTGTVEVVLVDKMVWWMVLAGGRGRREPVGAKVVAREILPVVVGRGVVDVLRLVATATFLRANQRN